jgi:hypothetical protein
MLGFDTLEFDSNFLTRYDISAYSKLAGHSEECNGQSHSTEIDVTEATTTDLTADTVFVAHA